MNKLNETLLQQAFMKSVKKLLRLFRHSKIANIVFLTQKGD